jgi:tetratricopeptide (TPR) repeat protein
MEQTLQTLKQALHLQRQGKLQDAERFYRRVLDQDADNVPGLNLLGALCLNTGRHKEAVRLIKRALAIKPDDPQALANLALGLKETGEIDAAIRSLEHSISLKGDNAFALDSLGNLLLESGRAKEAVTQYKKALQLNSGSVDCLCNLSSALNTLKQHHQALLTVRRALQLDDKNPQAHKYLADTYRAQSRFDDAIEHYSIALQLKADYYEAMLKLAHTQREAENPEASMAILGKLIGLQPSNHKALNAMGLLQEQLGEGEEAANYFKQSISIAPDVAISHYQLSQIKSRESTDEEIAAMESLLSDQTLSGEDKALLSFGLAPAYEQKERYGDAFYSWAKGNAIKASTSPYNETQTDTFYRSVAKDSYTALQRLGPKPGSEDKRPLFIMGMPRSGNTLTGQILSSHSRISNLGEMSFAYDMAEKLEELTGQKYPEGLENLTWEHCKQLGGMFAARVPEKFSNQSYIIDNTPLNFQHLGLISLALPQAKFIHCHRDPIDTCFSIFKIPFGNNQSYAHDLASLGKHYGSYLVLMQEWKHLLGDRILDVSYEETVSDIEGQSRRILEFLGLPFEETVLDFHESKDLVRTPSTSQVRKPIYKSAVQAWKRYEEYLGPLIENLPA